MTKREKYNAWGTALSIIFAVVSVLAALNPHSRLGPWLDHDAWGKLIIGVWTIAPPVFFWADWVFFCEAADREVAKHTHDLARNIWLGLLGVLTFTFFGAPWFS